MPNVKVQQKVTELQGYLNDLSGGFERLESAIRGSAEQSGILKSSFQGFSKALEEIQTFSKDLKTTLDSIVPQVKSGTQFNTNADQTIFSAYGKLVDVIVNSIDNSKLAKFQTVAKSVKAFSSSLKDIVTFSKEYGGDKFSKLVDTLNTKEGTNTKSKILDFINNFLPEGAKLETLNKNIEGVNSVVNAVRKYVSALRGLVSTGTKDIEVPEEWNRARLRFYEFVRGFDKEDTGGLTNLKELASAVGKYISLLKSLNKMGGDTPLNTELWKKTKKSFYEFIKSFTIPKDVSASIGRIEIVTKPIAKYLSELKSLNRLAEAGKINTEGWDKTRAAFYKFIKEFGIAEDVSAALTRIDTLTKAMGKYTIIISQLQRFGKEGGINTKSWDDVRLAFYEFLRGFKLEGDVPDAIGRLNTLTKAMSKYTTILTILNKTGSVSPETVKSWNDTRLEFYKFLRGFGTEGDIPDAIQRINQLMAGMYKYSQVLNTMQRVGSVSTTDVGKWNETRQAFYDFLRGFGTGGDVKDSYERLNKLVAGMYKYAQVLNTLQRVGAVDANATGAWETTRQEIIKFIESFKSQGTDSDKQLDAAANRANKLMTGLTKYSEVLRTLKSIGSEVPDIQAWNKVRVELFKFINEFGETGVQTDDDKLDKSAARASKLMTGLTKYADVIKTLQSIGAIDVNKDPDKWRITKEAIFGFIGLFAHQGTDTDDQLDEAGRRANKLMTGLAKYADVIRALQSVGSVGNTIPDKWKDTQKAVLEFLKSFRKVGFAGTQRADEEAVDSGAERLEHLMKGLVKYADAVRGLRSIGDIGSAIPGTVPTSWITIRDSVLKFIRGFGFSKDPALKDAEEELNAAAERMNDLVKGLVKYADAVRGLQSVKEVKAEDPKKWRDMRTLVLGFIRGFKDKGTPQDKDLEEASKRLNDNMKGMVKYVNVLKSLQSIGKVSSNDVKNWEDTRNAFITFINGFKPANQADATKLQENTKLVEDVGRSLQKFASVAKTMVSLGAFNPQTMASNLTTFIKELSDVVTDPRITAISDDIRKKFSNIANAFKGISSFINSMTKGSFANFATNLKAAVPEIASFIQQMASLAHLSAFPDFERVANAVGQFSGRFNDATKAVTRSSRAMTQFKSILRQIYTALVGGAVVYSIVRTIKTAVKEMYNLEYAMARVNTIARVSSSELTNMTHYVQEMSSTYGIASSKVTKALYDINSATIKGSASLKILEQSAKLAVAGFTDIEKVTDLLAKAVNAYQYNVAEASKISDILFVTVERGINPMEELSEYMGRLFTVAANAGVSLEEVGAGLATLTARGYQTNVASTALNSAILKLSTGTKELNKLFNQYGFASSASALRTKGLTGAIQILYKATGGATEKLHDLGFNYRDIRAATTLASSAIDEYTKTLALMNDETYKNGITNEALSKVQDTVIFKFNKLKETYTVFIQTISEYLNKNQVLKAFLDWLSKGLDNVVKSMRGVNLSLKEKLQASFVAMIPKFLMMYGILKLFSKPILAIADSFAVAQAAAVKAGKSFSKVAFMKTSFIAGLKSNWMLPLLMGTTVATETSSWISQINEAGTWGSGFKQMLGNYSRSFNFGGVQTKVTDAIGNFIVNLGGIASAGLGNLLDTIIKSVGGSTDFGSRWFNYFNPADYVDKKAVEESKQYQGNFNLTGFGSAVAKQISEIKKFNLIAENMNEDKLIQVYNDAVDAIQKEAASRKISKEQLDVAIKKASEQRDLMLSYNDTLKKLLPNTQALNDVFAQASKDIEEAVDKFASPLEKEIREVVQLQDAVSKISELSGWSEEQVKAGGASVTGSEQLKELWTEQQGVLADYVASFITTSVNTLFNNTDYKNKLKVAQDTLYSSFVALYKELLPSVSPEARKAVFNRMMQDTDFRDQERSSLIDLVNLPSNQGNATITKLWSKVSSGLQKVRDIENMPQFEKLSLGIEDFISDLRGLFSEEQINFIKEHKNDLLTALVELPPNLQQDSHAIAKKLQDIIANPEFAKQLNILGKTYLSAVQNADKFRKAISKMGFDLAKLSTEISVEDIIGNKFNIQSVREIKDKLKYTVYDPKTIMGADMSLVDQYAEMVTRGIMEHNPINDIVKTLVDKFKQNDALNSLDADELQRRAISFISSIQQIGTYTSAFIKQLSEIDYTKAMNRIRFGSELSHFKQYISFGKDMISNLFGIGVQGAKGASFGELLKTFESDTNAFGFNVARDNMIKKFKDAGETVWTSFSDMFKDLVNMEKEFVNPLNTEFKNIKKRTEDFIKNYEDALLTPVQRFYKTDAILQEQLAELREQEAKGVVDPELMGHILDNAEKLQKLNEELMNIKVPASITATEAVRTGSKEAFDLVATNVFRDIYKVNLQQKNYQKEIMNTVKEIGAKAGTSSMNLVTYPA